MPKKSANIAVTTTDNVPSLEASETVRDFDAIRRKIDALRSIFIPYPRATNVLARLDWLMRYGNSGHAVGSPARCFLLTGESGSGKTALLKYWMTKFPIDDSGLKTRRPVLFVEVPNNCTPKALAEQMLRSLGLADDLTVRGTEVTLTERVVHHLREQEVKVVILDEFQHFINSDKDQVIYKAADSVKRMLNAGTTSFVLSGTSEAALVYETNEQLKRRSAGRTKLGPFDWNVQAHQDFFRRALLEYERYLPFEQPSGLAAVPVSLRIHYYANGLLGRAVDLLMEATVMALETGAPCLNPDILRETVEHFRDDEEPEWLNPFDVAKLKPLNASELTEEKTRVTRLHRRGRRAKRLKAAA